MRCRGRRPAWRPAGIESPPRGSELEGARTQQLRQTDGEGGGFWKVPAPSAPRDAAAGREGAEDETFRSSVLLLRRGLHLTRGPAPVTWAFFRAKRLARALAKLGVPGGPLLPVSSRQRWRRQAALWQTPIHPSQPISNGPSSGKFPSPPPRGAHTGFLQGLSHSARLCPPLDQGALEGHILHCTPLLPPPAPRKISAQS